MTRLLAIDSATDALSLALLDEHGCKTRHRIIPRQHQQRLFNLLEELLEGRTLAALDLQAIVYGQGPGSFTGLRIAVSAAQGLAFSLGIPVVGVSSLETQVRTFLRTFPATDIVDQPVRILSCIDARIGQVYGQWFESTGDTLCAVGGVFVAPPEAIEIPSPGTRSQAPCVYGIGSGFELLDAMPEVIRSEAQCWPEVLPEAQDMFAPAQKILAAGQAQNPMQASPNYVQTRIGWKTLAEQGRVA
ncbi:MAG: tRNA (adenosine(37)-N6)-threonylcarbamoyltransferase complex dimerization subunit type 1 TsaB [Congregibacter sp.]|nr:tRNA (adenosine(37)-N6)-threonylcarbamoyltransferase complex dimerization subunit type 1 TsaB [Congregibacter sp.]